VVRFFSPFFVTPSPLPSESSNRSHHSRAQLPRRLHLRQVERKLPPRLRSWRTLHARRTRASRGSNDTTRPLDRSRPGQLDGQEWHRCVFSSPFPPSLLVLTPSCPIGTDATIAEHIAKIIDREYVFKQRDGQVERLVPSTLGIGLVKAYDQVGLDNSLSKPHLRRLVRPPVLPLFALSPC
jgi:hypothetical protein